MNCILIDKKSSLYFITQHVQSSRAEFASIINIPKAKQINRMSNYRYGLLLPVISDDNLPFGYLSFTDYLLTKMYSEEF